MDIHNNLKYMTRSLKLQDYDSKLQWFYNNKETIVTILEGKKHGKHNLNHSMC